MMETALVVCVILLAIVTAVAVRQKRHYDRSLRKIGYMFDSIKNLDYSFSFPVDKVSRKDLVMNASLNRIKKLINDARLSEVEKEKYYECIIDSADTGILVLDEHGFVLLRNSAALRLLGLEVLNHVSQLGRVSSALEKDFENLRPGEKRLVTFSDERGEVHLALRESEVRLRGESRSLVSVSDINSELDENEIDSWLRLTRILSHEIMNSMTPLTSLSETLLKKVRSGASPEKMEDIAQGLEVINKTGSELIRFVQSYRSFTHVPEPRPTLFYVRQFAERMVSMTRQADEASSIAFHVEVEPDELIVYADEDLIGHVVANILKNAIQAPGTKNIWFRAYSDSREAVVMDIGNDGEPIPEDVARHIFTPFFTTKKSGSGIGLSIARQIMRLSGGSISLLSASPRTIFELRFP
jgi:nitrogen fixation/metabolism regulation signal transduction histidine kinase